MHPTEAEFRATAGPRRASQCDKVLARLEDSAGAWVSLPELVRVSGAYAVHSRVSDLRRRGYSIEQASEHRDGLVHSSYRLVDRPSPVNI
jgi:hypothetical protein